MKKILLCLGTLLSATFVNAQNGLENIIVEKYYISDANDTSVNANGGVLPIGSVTYRIYADMLPGYRFQAGYGVNTVGAAHELRIATTTLFFNNEDRGATTPAYSKSQARDNTVMLDSWLSVGAACTGNFGVLKTDDDGVATNVNNDGVLQNADPLAGIPLTVQDGLLLGTPEPVTQVGIATEIAVFDSQNDGTNGPVFSTFNGSWASLNGSVGPDPDTNRVLIGQITTDGVLTFELNIQIGVPGGGVENYVAKNPVGNEISIPSLTYPVTTGVVYVNSTAKTLNVYPNPAKDRVTIAITSPSKTVDNSYTIYDITGKVMLHSNIGVVAEKYSKQIDVSSFADGLYFIQVSLDGAVSTKKIVKN